MFLAIEAASRYKMYTQSPEGLVVEINNEITPADAEHIGQKIAELFLPNTTLLPH